MLQYTLGVAPATDAVNSILSGFPDLRCVQVIPGLGVMLEITGVATQNPYLPSHATGIIKASTLVDIAPSPMPGATTRVLRINAVDELTMQLITVEEDKAGKYVHLIGNVQSWMNLHMHKVVLEAPLVSRRSFWLREFKKHIYDTLTLKQQAILERLGFIDTVGLSTNSMVAVLRHARSAYKSDLASVVTIERSFESSVYLYADAPTIHLGVNGIIHIGHLGIDCGSREDAGNFRDAVLAICRYISENPIPYAPLIGSPNFDGLVDQYQRKNKTPVDVRQVLGAGHRFTKPSTDLHAYAEFASGSDVGNPLPGVGPSFHDIALSGEYDLGIPGPVEESPAAAPQTDTPASGE